jgi:short-subunit dehydrogenase
MFMKQTVLITGGSQGIGLELARIFAANDFDLVLVARRQEQLDQAAQELRKLGAGVTVIAKDLFDTANARALHDEVQARQINIDVLVNNAGQGLFGKFIETDLEEEMAIVQLNICSLVTLTKLFVKDMLQRGAGKILNVSSIAGKVPGPYQSVYHGTKAFVHSFTEAVRNELKDTGVTLTSLLPGATDTDFFHKADMEASKIAQDDKLADPAQVAKDGYEALMQGKDMVVSGMQNKLLVAMSNVLPDSLAAETMRKQQEPRKEQPGES